MDKIKNAVLEAAAHVFAVWICAARWVSAHPNWTLWIWIATILIGVKF